MNTFKTAKGTTIPISDIRGKDYMDVKWRLVWFREEHPDWTIETESIHVAESGAYFKAYIKNEAGQVLATAHKTCTSKEFTKFVEKAETGAIGRALAHCGFGTQFTGDELIEDEQTLADSPVSKRRAGAEVTPQNISKPSARTQNQTGDFF